MGSNLQNENKYIGEMPRLRRPNQYNYSEPSIFCPVHMLPTRIAILEERHRPANGRSEGFPLTKHLGVFEHVATKIKTDATSL